MSNIWHASRAVAGFVPPALKSISEGEAINQQSNSEGDDNNLANEKKKKKKKQKSGDKSKTKTKKMSSLQKKDDERSFEAKLKRLQNSTSLRLYRTYALDQYCEEFPHFKLLPEFQETKEDNQ